MRRTSAIRAYSVVAVIGALNVTAQAALPNGTVITDTQANYSPTVQGTYNGSAGSGTPGTYTYGGIEFPYSNARGASETADPVNTGTFYQLTPNGGNWTGPGYCCGGNFPVLTQTGGHGYTNGSGEGTTPLGTAEAPDRVWTSNYTGEVTISGDYRSENVCCNSAQRPSVYVNGTQYLLDPIGGGNGETAVAGSPSPGYYPTHMYSITVPINVGDNISWVMNPGYNYYGNAFEFTGTVTAVPEPVAAGLSALGALALLRRRRVS